MGISAGIVATLYSAEQARKAGNRTPPPPPAAMPTVNDEGVKNARRKQIAEIQSRSGRAATILTDPSAKLGG